jgi:hypothetical protein
MPCKHNVKNGQITTDKRPSITYTIQVLLEVNIFERFENLQIINSIGLGCLA